MLRVFSMFGLGGIFLAISPKLRGSVQEAIGSVYTGMQLYSPFSYVAFVILVLIALLTSFRRGAQAR
ncbi:MAG: hypothetical protein JWP63_2247 [Candidatus Solibacter sp.]|jgi:hypothetical protein|nr:hypothetical protein [Candidatus Solibacter sp.]